MCIIDACVRVGVEVEDLSDEDLFMDKMNMVFEIFGVEYDIVVWIVLEIELDEDFDGVFCVCFVSCVMGMCIEMVFDCKMFVGVVFCMLYDIWGDFVKFGVFVVFEVLCVEIEVYKVDDLFV